MLLFTALPVSIYAAVLIYFWLGQRSLIYLPSQLSATTPRQFGVDYEEVYFETKDGAKLNAWWLSHGEEAPTLLYFHGNAANLSMLAEVASLFFKSDWNVLLFDYRGYGKSTVGSLPLSEGTLHEDSLAAYNWLIKRGISERQIFFWGHSLGSAIATSALNIAKPTCMILEGAFPSLYSVARMHYPWLALFPGMIWDKYETARTLEKAKIPILLIHAEKDEIIPFQLGEQLYKEAPEPKRWLTLKGIGHNDFPSVFIQYRTSLQEFVAEFVK